MGTSPSHRPDPRPVIPGCRPVGLPAALRQMLGSLVVASLVARHGFGITALGGLPLDWLDLILALGYAADLVSGAVIISRRRTLWRERGLDLLLLAGWLTAQLAVALLAARAPAETMRFFDLADLHELYSDLTQFFLLSALFLQLLRLQQSVIGRGVRPEWLLGGSFALLILAGTLLLLLPRAAASAERPVTLLDAFFTATSAACVTGLTVRDTGADFSTFGHSVIMGLFQMGGLGIMTFVAFVSVFSSRSLPLPQMIAFKQMVSSRTMAELKSQIVRIVLLTVLIELAGAAAIYVFLPTSDAVFTRIKWSLFHAVSAFCNAGFGLESDSLVSLQSNWGINVSVMLLIILGSLGFLVIPDLLGFKVFRLPLLRRLPVIRRWSFGRVPARLSVQTRISLVVTVALLLLGFVGFWCLEAGHSLADRSLPDGLLISAFQSVTTRTAGFNSIDIGGLQDATLILFIALMVIGACPVSTGGGIKTVTLGVLLFTMRSMIQGREHVEAFGRTLPARTVSAALSVFVIYVTCAVTGLFLLALSDPQMSLQDQAFELVSALSTVGLSTGITSQFSPAGKLVLCLAMFVGRVGPIALVLSIFQATRHPGYRYPEEEIVVG